MKRITKPDIILFALLILAGSFGFAAMHFFQKQTGTYVQITVDGVLYGTYDLNQTSAADPDEPVTIPVIINGTETNTLQILNHKANMIQADCPDQLCVHQKAIGKQGETIVCLPNRVVAEIKGGSTSELDSVSR